MTNKAMDRRAKIVATLGPASEDDATVQKLIECGVNITRLNFSHGTHEQHAARIERVRRISHRLGIPITILQDLQGPKIRIGNIEGGKIELIEGHNLTLTTQPVPGSSEIVSVDYAGLPRIVKPGGRILLSDGQMELQIVRVENDTIETQVVLGGILTPHKGVNLPGAQIDIPCFTEKDEADLKFGLEHGIDVVAMSFIRTARDVERVRKATAILGQITPRSRSSPSSNGPSRSRTWKKSLPPPTA